MKHELAGRTVAITGGTGGLGLALAEALLARKARVALLDLDAANVATQADRLGSPNVVRGWQADVRDLDNLQEVMDDVDAHFGRLDIVIAGAGVGTPDTLGTCTEENWDMVIDVNLNGVWRTFKAALPYMRKYRGHLVGISSMAGFIHSPLNTSYVASKAGVWALCNALRLEYEHAGIGVTSVHPTFFKTPMVDEMLTNEAAVMVFNGFKGVFKMTTIEVVVRDIIKGLERRRDHVISPKSQYWASLAPGVARLLAIKIAYSPKNIKEAVKLTEQEFANSSQ